MSETLHAHINELHSHIRHLQERLKKAERERDALVTNEQALEVTLADTQVLIRELRERIAELEAALRLIEEKSQGAVDYLRDSGEMLFLQYAQGCLDTSRSAFASAAELVPEAPAETRKSRPD